MKRPARRTDGPGVGGVSVMDLESCWNHTDPIWVSCDYPAVSLLACPFCRQEREAQDGMERGDVRDAPVGSQVWPVFRRYVATPLLLHFTKGSRMEAEIT